MKLYIVLHIRPEFYVSLMEFMFFFYFLEENLQFGIEELELDGIINGFDNELKQEIIRKLEEEDDADDERDMNHLDSLTSLLEGIAPMDLLEGKVLLFFPSNTFASYEYWKI